MSKIGIIDYGMGNLHSVKNALDYIGINSFISHDIEELKKSDSLILPGVGAFPDAMKSLNRLELVDFIKAEVKIKPLLGICLGMQLLFNKSFEFIECDGLGLIDGEVVKISAYINNRDYKIPHMGWNSLKYNIPSQLLKGIDEFSRVYFVHSYKAKVRYREDLVSYSDYGEEITAIVQHNNIYGTQFHPEKSEKVGLEILKNFGELIK